jgi:dGTPase
LNSFEILPIWDQRKSATQNLRQQDHRSIFQRDRARILHSAAFRRLQAKTQVVGIGQSDFYRTRLTHSLEVAQIGAGINAQLRLKYPKLAMALNDDMLIEALGLSHDIGHPPFGHGGEIALNFMMRNHGGFEGNGQTFRILTRLEPYTEHHGMNLTRRTLLGILKYPVLHSQVLGDYCDSKINSFRQLKASNWLPPKAIFDVDSSSLDWVLSPFSDNDRKLFARTKTSDGIHLKSCYKSLDCSIMELADDIAYSVHDLEDAIVMATVDLNQWQQDVVSQIALLNDNWISQNISEITNQLFGTQQFKRKDAIGKLVNALITAIEITEQREFDDPLLRFNAKLQTPYANILDILKKFVLERVINKPEFQAMEYKGQQIVMELFEAFASDPNRLLPDNTKQRWHTAHDKKDDVKMRIIADYISGMTDEFAAKLYHTLFTPKGHSFF